MHAYVLLAVTGATPAVANVHVTQVAVTQEFVLLMVAAVCAKTKETIYEQYMEFRDREIP